MRYCCSFILSLLTITCFAQRDYINPTFEQINACGLPVVVINTVNEEEPTSDIINAPEGEYGVSITNVTKVPGSMYILQGTDTLYSSGDYVDDESGITIRHRGNTSAQWAKKPYKIKLQKKADLLCRGDKKYKDKDWLLLTTYNLHLPIGLKLNELIGFSWTPSYQLVNVFINNDYRGVYTLIENVKRNADARLDVDSDEGYIFECDPYWWNENVYFTTDSGKHFSFKYPDDKDITQEQIDYLCDYMNQFEQSLQSGTYGDYIDVESFARWMLARDMLGNADAAGGNLYMEKYDNDSKIGMTTLWDFDMIAKVPTNSFSRVHDRYFYFSELFDEHGLFVYTYKQLWKTLMPSLYQNLKREMKTLAQSAEADALMASCKYDQVRWDYYDAEPLSVEYMNYFSYFDEHISWLDQAIEQLDDTANILGVESTSDSADNERIYSITGQMVNPSCKGIYIKGGRKYAVIR